MRNQIQVNFTRFSVCKVFFFLVVTKLQFIYRLCIHYKVSCVGIYMALNEIL